MIPAKLNCSDSVGLFARAKALRSDQRGSLTLLAGMMVFLVTIMSMIALDTNKAIYNRIIAQNAVDAAADSAALWQARGCNLVQILNNLHYDVDEALCIAEGVAAGACIASAALLVAELAADIFFGAGEVTIREARMVTCIGCWTLPWIDYAQQLFYKAIMPVQQAIVMATPYVAFGYASMCAKGSKADPIGAALTGTMQSLLSTLGINSPAISGVGGAISSILGSIPIYAVPLDPDGFGLFDPENKGLYVKKKDNDGSPPLKWWEEIGEAGAIAGKIGCEDVPANYLNSESLASDAGWDGTWGWDDQYYYGHPGFSTWIAGKAQTNELLGLGNLKWFNGGMKSPDYQVNAAQVSKVMYDGDVVDDGAIPLSIPGFIAIASSQVEGTPVICHGDVNAQGKLIKVYIPSGSSPKAAEDYFIYH